MHKINSFIIGLNVASKISFSVKLKAKLIYLMKCFYDLLLTVLNIDTIYK